MITRKLVSLYRIVAATIALLPLAIDISFNTPILYSILYLPLSSLLLVSAAKYIDFHLMKEILLQEKVQKLDKIKSKALKVTKIKQRKAA